MSQSINDMIFEFLKANLSMDYCLLDSNYIELTVKHPDTGEEHRIGSVRV